jgi:hypothetical protein
MSLGQAMIHWRVLVPTRTSIGMLAKAGADGKGRGIGDNRDRLVSI